MFRFYHNILRNATKLRAKYRNEKGIYWTQKVFAKDVEARLVATIQAEVERGCMAFTMGTHGKFDSLALTACRNLRRTYKELDIEIVITGLNAIKKDSELSADPYVDECAYRSGAKTAMRYAKNAV